MSDGQDDDRWSKAQRLAVAGSIAPALRNQSEAAAKRRVARVDKDGNVVGYTTVLEVQKALLLTRQIEMEVQEGVRPTEAICEACGLPFVVGSRGQIAKTCEACTAAPCSDCGKRLTGRQYKKSKRCRDCYQRNHKPRVKCQNCGAELCRAQCTPGVIAKRERAGRPPRCGRCTIAARSHKRVGIVT